MSYKLAVWHSERAISSKEAAELFAKLYEHRKVPLEQHIDVYSFYNELGARYPEVDMVAEEDLDGCPWACAHERSGAHVILSMLDDKSTEVLPTILELAEKHGLVCFDPQANKVNLPSHLQSTVTTSERGGTLFIVEMDEGQGKEYEVGFGDHGSMSRNLKMAQIVGEDKLVEFLTEEIGVESAKVDSAISELKKNGQARVRDVVLSDADLLILGLR
ncbi:MAG TPA: hypothetical protein VJX16_27030 [Terriglobales bacterium]|nr:hypothetical protein [Terriglobales bacterium]